jgi:hypothetical protein
MSGGNVEKVVVGVGLFAAGVTGLGVKEIVCTSSIWGVYVPVTVRVDVDEPSAWLEGLGTVFVNTVPVSVFVPSDISQLHVTKTTPMRTINFTPWNITNQHQLKCL